MDINQMLTEDLLEKAEAEVERLRAAIVRHHSQKADDLCWMDDNELYAAAGLPPRDNTVGDPEAMLANCKRYIAQRCQNGGPWKSYAELEAEVERLRTENAALRQSIELCSGSCRLPEGKP